MKCPYCGYSESKVVDTRPTEEGEKIRRRRECLKCEKRFTSYEAIDTIPMMVIKKDGSREAFSKDKLLRGMLKSSEKRAVSLAKLEEVVCQIETTLHNRMDREVFSSEIGELCMEKLKNLDQVAYVRFASVYRQFEDVNSFLTELKNILEMEKGR